MNTSDCSSLTSGHEAWVTESSFHTVFSSLTNTAQDVISASAISRIAGVNVRLENGRMFKHDLGDGAELRVLERRHAAEFLAFIESNRAHLSTWLGWGERITALEDARGFIERGIKRYAEDGLPWVGLWLDGRMAGGLLFFPLDRQSNSTEMGYWLGEHATGRGLMTRAVRAMLGFVFDDLGINRLVLHADVRNAPSRAVAERLGFRLEGIERQSWLLHGQYTDNALYAMLAEEWRQHKGNPS